MSVLQRLTEQRLKGDFTILDERKCLSAMITLLKEGKVTKIEGNEALFASLFDDHFAALAIYNGADVLIRTKPEYHLLFYYYLERMLKAGKLPPPLEAECHVAVESDVAETPCTLQNEDLSFYMIELTSSLRGKNMTDTTADSVLTHILRALIDRLDSLVGSSLVNQARQSEIYKLLLEKEKTFDVAYFFIHVFANIPSIDCNEISELVEQSKNLIAKCKVDVVNIIGQEPGFYEDVWTRLYTWAQARGNLTAIRDVIHVGLTMFNTRQSFALLHNRCTQSLGGVATGDEGLVATLCRFGAFMTYRNRIEIDFEQRLVQNFNSMYGKVSTDIILLRFKQIFTSAMSIAFWQELTDSLSGRLGEGALRLSCAVDRIKLPSVGKPTFFYALDVVPSIEFNVAILSSDDDCRKEILPSSNPWDYYFKVGPDDFPLLVAARFASSQCRTRVPIDFAVNSTLRVIFDTGSSTNLPISVVKLVHCVYFEQFKRNENRFLFEILESLLEDAKTKKDFFDQMLEDYKSRLEHLQHLQTFGIDCEYLCSITPNELMKQFTAKETAALRQEVERLSARVLEELANDRDRNAQMEEKETLDRIKKVTLSRGSEISTLKTVATVFRSGETIALDEGRPIPPQPTSASVTISQPDAGFSQSNVAPSQSTAVDVSQTIAVSSQSLAVDLSQSSQSLAVDLSQPNVEPTIPKSRHIAVSTSRHTATAVQSNAETKKVDADEDVDDKITPKKTPAKRGRKRKAPVVTTEEDPEYFISYCFSNDNDRNNPIACANRWGVFFYFDWPFVCDIGTPSGDNLVQDFDFFEPSRKSAALSCLYPFIDVKEVEYWREKNDGSEFSLNIWTKNRPAELQNLQEPKLFLKRRQQFLQTWAKKLWLLEDGSYLVHLNAEIEDMVEFDRLILGHGFLKFSKTCLEKSLNPQERALRLQYSATNYPWRSGDEALQWLDPKNDVVCAKENLFRRKDQLLMTKMTIADLCAHLERNKPNIVDRTQPKSDRNTSRRLITDIQHVAQSRFDNDNDDGESDADGGKPNKKPFRTPNSAVKSASIPFGIIRVAKNFVEYDSEFLGPQNIRLVLCRDGKQKKILETDYQDLLAKQPEMSKLDTFDTDALDFAKVVPITTNIVRQLLSQKK